MFPAPRSLPHPRLAYPDAFKLVAILGVIVAHLPPARFSPNAWATIEVWHGATAWCVLGFFAVAGVLFRQGDSRPVRAELLKRARRLLVPWAAFSVLYKIAIPSLAVAGLVQRYPLPSADFAGFLQWLVVPADPQLYFLLYLFGIQAVFLVLRRADVLFPVVAGVVALGMWLWNVGEGRSPSYLHGSSAQLLPLYLAFFIAGTVCGTSLARVAAALLVFGVVGLVAALLLGGGWLVAWQLVAPWLLLVGLQALESSGALRPLAALGRLSGSVYVWHAPLVIGLVSIFCAKILGPDPAAAFATVVLTFLLAAVVGWLVNQARFLRWFQI